MQPSLLGTYIFTGGKTMLNMLIAAGVGFVLGKVITLDGVVRVYDTIKHVFRG